MFFNRMVMSKEIVHSKVREYKRQLFYFIYSICFIGLTAVESGKLSNFFHFREPIQLQKKSLIHRQALDKSLHFLDTIDEDIPKGIDLSFNEKK